MCDLKWLWKVTQAPLSALHLSSKIKYFIEPYRVIKKYKEGGLHPSNSKIESLELGVVWTFISKRNFNKKHNSLEDVRAQTDVITHDQFVRYIDTGFAVQDVLDIFTATQRRSFLKGMESIRPVHEPWIEVTPEHDVTWEPDSADSYTGRSGGGFPGPTAYIQQIARNAVSLACMFFAVLPWSFFVLVAQRTQKYAYEDWVVEKYGEDRDGNPRKKYHLEPCAAESPGCRHRADNFIKHNKKYTITPAYVLCFIAMLLLQGAHFGADKRHSRSMWRKPPRGLDLPYVRNAMPAKAY